MQAPEGAEGGPSKFKMIRKTILDLASAICRSVCKQTSPSVIEILRKKMV